MNALWIPSLPLGHIALRAVVVYLSVLVLLRLGGKRQIGQMGAGEFVALLLVSNAAQNSMNGGDNSVTAGLILASIIIASSYAISYLTFRSKRLEGIVQGRPTLLIHKGQPVDKNLAKEHINLYELKAILRRQGIQDLTTVHQAVLESNGMISVLKKSELPGQA